MVGYACVAGSMVFYSKAKESRDQYIAATTSDWQTYYNDKSVFQFNISKALAAGAVVIWVSDLIWTVAGTSKLKKRPLYGNFNGISISTDIEPLCFAPMVRLRYTF